MSRGSCIVYSPLFFWMVLVFTSLFSMSDIVGFGRVRFSFASIIDFIWVQLAFRVLAI